MSGAKIIEVCNRYEDRLRDKRENHKLIHVRDRMVPLTREFAESGRLEKAFRWLGFMQGVLWSEGVYSIDELKSHNKPDGEGNQ